MATPPTKTQFPLTGNEDAPFNRFAIPGMPTGNVFYVHANGTSTGPGFTPLTAYSTVNAAVAAATASNGDTIFILPGHTETITGAGGVAISKAGLTVIGLGVGRNRPTFTFTTANGASFDISAANCTVAGLNFVNGKDGQTAMVNVSAAQVTIRDCEFQLGDSSTQTTEGIVTTAAANRLLVEGCNFHSTTDAGVTDAIHVVGGDNIIIRDNVFTGAVSASGFILNDTTATTNILIVRNTFLNQTADGNNKVVVMHANATGLLAGSLGGIIDSSGPAPVTFAAGWVAGNYFSSAVGVGAASVLL